MKEIAALIQQICIREGPPCCPLQILERPCPKPAPPACASVCSEDAHSLYISPGSNLCSSSTCPDSLVHFHSLAFSGCSLGTASIQLETLLIFAGEKPGCFIPCVLPGPNPVLNDKDQDLVLTSGQTIIIRTIVVFVF